MEFHPIANIYPMMTGDDYRALVDDIRENGQREPIYLYEDMILDGRNRYAACLEIGIEPKYKEYTGNEPTKFVISYNEKRRHLTPSQRAACALAALPHLEVEAKKRQGERSDLSVNLCQRIDRSPERATEQAAQMFGTNRQYVSDAKVIAVKAPELIEMIRQGEMTIPQAKREIVKRERQDTPPLPFDKYRVIYADPPWKYGNDGVINNDNYGHVGRHYPSMSIDELCALDVKALAEDNAVLFMWVTSPLLAECWPVIKAWGFEYKTSFVWDKVKHNFGHYNSVRHELLLICTRGSCTPDNLELIDSVQSIERTNEHSQKPEEFRQIIDRLYTHGRKLELFARCQVDGWEAWGNE